MHWSNILWAVLLLILIVWMAPRAKQMVENSPKGSAADWMGFIIPVAAIALFIAFLIWLV